MSIHDENRAQLLILPLLNEIISYLGGNLTSLHIYWVIENQLGYFDSLDEINEIVCILF
jgi:hypothetical protein